jgi:hypothetical protein
VLAKGRGWDLRCRIQDWDQSRLQFDQSILRKLNGEEGERDEDAEGIEGYRHFG